MQCVHVFAIWKFNDHVGEGNARFMNEGRLCCLRSFWVSLWTLKSEVREGAFFIYLRASLHDPGLLFSPG